MNSDICRVFIIFYQKPNRMCISIVTEIKVDNYFLTKENI